MTIKLWPFNKNVNRNKKKAIDDQLLSIDPDTSAAIQHVGKRNHCKCLQGKNKKGNLLVHSIHAHEQDKTVTGWQQTTNLIIKAKQDKNTIFEPSAKIEWDDWTEVITLPKDIEHLKAVKEMRLYASHLQRLPPEIGQMKALENLDIYTSYSLHWLPYEITRCSKLSDSRMSTRALYGNRKTRLPFPPIKKPMEVLLPETCSVCDRPFGERSPSLYWITLPIGTDIVPLLIHSCSDECIKSVPTPPNGYFQRPHKGGGGVGMPNF